MEIRPVGVALIYAGAQADRQTDRHDETYESTFRGYGISPKTCKYSSFTLHQDRRTIVLIQYETF